MLDFCGGSNPDQPREPTTPHQPSDQVLLQMNLQITVLRSSDGRILLTVEKQ